MGGSKATSRASPASATAHACVMPVRPVRPVLPAEARQRLFLAGVWGSLRGPGVSPSACCGREGWLPRRVRPSLSSAGGSRNASETLHPSRGVAGFGAPHLGKAVPGRSGDGRLPAKVAVSLRSPPQYILGI